MVVVKGLHSDLAWREPTLNHLSAKARRNTACNYIASFGKTPTARLIERRWVRKGVGSERT